MVFPYEKNSYMKKIQKVFCQSFSKKHTIPPNFALKNTNPALKKFLDAVKLYKNALFGRSSVITYSTRQGRSQGGGFRG